VWLYSVRCIHDKFAQLILYIRNRITAVISGTTVDGQRRMLRAKKPCRQLNSEAIKSAALCPTSQKKRKHKGRKGNPSKKLSQPSIASFFPSQK